MLNDEVAAGIELFKEGHIKQTDLLNILTDEIVRMREREITLSVQILLLNKRFDIQLTKPGYVTWSRRKIEKGFFEGKNKVKSKKKFFSIKDKYKKNDSINQALSNQESKHISEPSIQSNMQEKTYTEEEQKKIDMINELKLRRMKELPLTLEEEQELWDAVAANYSTKK